LPLLEDINNLPTTSLSNFDNYNEAKPICLKNFEIIALEKQTLNFYEKSLFDGVLGLSFG